MESLAYKPGVGKNCWLLGHPLRTIIKMSYQGGPKSNYSIPPKADL